MIMNALKESKKIFSLRKLSVGLCSVVLGTMFLTIQNTSVEASTTDHQQVETIKNATESNVVVQAETAGQEEKTVDNKGLEPQSTQEDKQVETSTTDHQRVETIKNTESQTKSNVVVQAETAGQKEKSVDNKALKPQSAQEGKQVDAATKDQQHKKTQSNKNAEPQTAVSDQRQVTVNDDKRQESQSVLNDTTANKIDESDALNTAKTQSAVQDNKKSSALGEEVAKKIEGKTSTDSTAASVNKSNELIISKAGKKVNLSQAAYRKLVYSNQWVIRNGKNYYYDAQGHQIRNQWAAPTGTWYYFGNEGYTIENQWYAMSDGNYYYFGNDGHTVRNRWYTMPDGNAYYFANDGHRVINRWYTMSDGNTYYFANDGHRVINRWHAMPDGNYYYFGNDGHRVINRWYAMPDGNYYYFANDGHRVINRWYTMPDGNTYYFANDGHRVINRWYTMPDGNTYYFANDGHRVINRWYTLPSGGEYYFDETGHVKPSQINNLSIDGNTTKLSGQLSGNGAVWVKDSNGKETFQCLTNTFFTFDASRYAGEKVTVEIKPDATPDSEVFSSESIQIPELMINNIAVDHDTRKVSGRLTGTGAIWVKDSNGKETFQCYADSARDFTFDASRYAGEGIDLEIKPDPTSDSKVIPSFGLNIPELMISDATVDSNTRIVSGEVNGTGALWIKDLLNGKETFLCRTSKYGTFTFDASQYAGENITLEIRPDASLDSKVNSYYGIHIPELKFGNVTIDPDTRKVSGEVNGTGALWLMDSNGKETFQCLTNEYGTFTFDASRYAGENITLEIKLNESSDSKTICSQNIKIPALAFNYLSFNVDPDVPKISGDLNGDGAIWIKDSSGHEEFQCYTDHRSFVLDASRYAGKDVTVEVKADASPDSKVIISESGHVISLPTISNLSIDPNTRMISGKVNRRSSIWVKEPNGKVTCVFGGVNDNFSFDANQYSGENITVGIGDSQPYYRYPISVPAITISNISVNPDTMVLSGKVNGSATLWVESPDGSEKSYDYASEIDASQYSGENIIIKLRAGDTLDSRVISSKKVYIPSLEISDVRVKNLMLSGRVNGQANIYIKLPDGTENWESFTDKGTYEFSIDVGQYKGQEIVIEAKPAQGSRVITTKKVKIPLL